MNTDETTYIQEIIEAHKKRLHNLEVKAALQGIDTPPAIQIEIESIKKKIDGHQRELDRVKEREQLESNLSNIFEEQNASIEELILNSKMVDLKEEIRQTIETVLKDMLSFENRVEQEEGVSINDPNWFRDMAKGFALSGNWILAAEYYDKYVKFDPENWEVHFVRGVAYANTRQGKDTNVASLRAYNEAIVFIPDEIDDNFRARLFAYRGAILKRLKKLDEAEANLILAQKYASADYEVNDIKYNLAAIYAMRGNRQKLMQMVHELKYHQPEKLVAIQGHLNDYFAQYAEDKEFIKAISL